jgi:hypothetical protein
VRQDQNVCFWKRRAMQESSNWHIRIGSINKFVKGLHSYSAATVFDAPTIP